jgi:hypothetical protein
MRSPTAADVLRIWEQGQARRGPDRAVALLAAAFPETSPEDAADLPVGARDVLLLRLRAMLFGPVLNGFTECPSCRSRLELQWQPPDSAPPPEASGHLSTEGYDVRFRLPTTRDLRAIAACADVAEARSALIRRCVLEASRDGAPFTADALPDSVTTTLAERMAECDPGAETLLNLDCPACGHRWQAPLDVAAFVWAEINALSRRLLREVRTLARAYGWREPDILAMSAVRRQAYLEMAGAGG